MRLTHDRLKNHYIESWRSLLTNLADWDNQRFGSWINTMALEDDLDDEDSGLYSEPPEYWAITPIIKHHFQSNISRADYLDLHERLLNVLSASRHNYTRVHQWSNLRKRVLVEITTTKLASYKEPIEV
jgi:hypothetical protein